MSMLRIKASIFQFVANAFVNTKGGGEVIYQNIDGENGPIRVLKYLPTNSKQSKYPVHVHLHGGGFVVGIADMDNAWCRRIAEETGSVVLSIDYAKAPQHPFPAALHNIRDVVLSISKDADLDESRLTIGGLSAGGNLALAWTVYCLQNNLTVPVLLLPVYPPTDISLNYNDKLNAVSEEARAKSLPAWIVDLFDASYTDNRADMLVSPGRAPDTLLAKFPKTIVLTAELDCLHIEADLLANRLSENGVEVIHHIYPGAVHGYANKNANPGTADAIAKEETLRLVIQEIKKVNNQS
ncbi:hypothetical protein NQZ79_g5739 [Umbelopsis isabellina]|nr:hypothetical protein NQZ79_g5739 [Umbelopsis isabellina]